MPRSVRALSPGVGAAGRSVVGQHPDGGNAAGGEPGHGVAEHADGRGGDLVVMDLGEGDAAVVVDDGVHERGPDLRVVVSAPGSGVAALRPAPSTVGPRILTSVTTLPLP